MAVISGVIDGFQLVSGNPTNVTAPREDHLFVVDFGAAGSSDTGQVLGVGAALAAATHSGKTYTLRQVLCAFPGTDSVTTPATLVYTGTIVVSGDNITFSFTDKTGTALGVALNGPSKVGFIACFDITGG